MSFERVLEMAWRLGARVMQLAFGFLIVYGPAWTTIAFAKGKIIFT